METCIRVLLIEDNPADADLIEELLCGEGESAFVLIKAERLSEGIERLQERGIDIVLLDLSLPDSQGLETFGSVHDKAAHTPVIVLSGLDDQAIALEAVHRGAQDYLVKGKVDRDLLARAIHYAIERHRLLMELDGFAHTVSHDLKGPLAAIKLSNETIKTLVKAPRTEETITDVDKLSKVMDASINKVSALIEDILALAEAGQTPTELSVVEVKEVVDRILEEKRGEIEERGVAFEVSPDLGRVTANSTHVYQLFVNLIGNAMRHNDSPNPEIDITYLGKNESGLHRYRVKDNGSGLPPDVIDKVFLPFAKGASGGTGIGLSIVAKIVEVYGGYVNVRNDNGVCFEFALKDFKPGIL